MEMISFNFKVLYVCTSLFVCFISCTFYINRSTMFFCHNKSKNNISQLQAYDGGTCTTTHASIGDR